MKRAFAPGPWTFIFILGCVSVSGCEPERITIPTAQQDRVHDTQPTLHLAGSYNGEEARQKVIEALRGDLADVDRHLRERPRSARELSARRRQVLAKLNKELQSAPDAPNASSESDATTDSSESDIYIVAHGTQVSIWDTGPSSGGRVMVWTQLNVGAHVDHHVSIKQTVNGRQSSWGNVHDGTGLFWTRYHSTDLHLNGLNCDIGVRIDGSAKHEVYMFGDFKDGAFSQDNHSCGQPSAFECGNDPVYADNPATGGPYEPNPNEDPYTECDGGGNDAGGSGCTQEYVYVEIFNEETGVWEVYWEGYATVCG